MPRSEPPAGSVGAPLQVLLAGFAPPHYHMHLRTASSSFNLPPCHTPASRGEQSQPNFLQTPNFSPRAAELRASSKSPDDGEPSPTLHMPLLFLMDLPSMRWTPGGCAVPGPISPDKIQEPSLACPWANPTKLAGYVMGMVGPLSPRVSVS